MACGCGRTCSHSSNCTCTVENRGRRSRHEKPQGLRGHEQGWITRRFGRVRGGALRARARTRVCWALLGSRPHRVAAHIRSCSPSRIAALLRTRPSAGSSGCVRCASRRSRSPLRRARASVRPRHGTRARCSRRRRTRGKSDTRTTCVELSDRLSVRRVRSQSPVRQRHVLGISAGLGVRAVQSGHHI